MWVWVCLWSPSHGKEAWPGGSLAPACVCPLHDRFPPARLGPHGGWCPTGAGAGRTLRTSAREACCPRCPAIHPAPRSVCDSPVPGRVLAASSAQAGGTASGPGFALQPSRGRGNAPAQSLTSGEASRTVTALSASVSPLVGWSLPHDTVTVGLRCEPLSVPASVVLTPARGQTAMTSPAGKARGVAAGHPPPRQVGVSGLALPSRWGPTGPPAPGRTVCEGKLPGASSCERGHRGQHAPPWRLPEAGTARSPAPTGLSPGPHGPVPGGHAGSPHVCGPGRARPPLACPGQGCVASAAGQLAPSRSCPCL